MKRSVVAFPLSLKKRQTGHIYIRTLTQTTRAPVSVQNAVMVTLLCGDVFRITHQEMIKGIMRDGTYVLLDLCVASVSVTDDRLGLGLGLCRGTYHKYFDTITVPIVENTAEEADLRDRMAAAMRKYPEACAVLVRRHGVYVWGPTWQKAKSMCECYDYLFEMYVKMRQMGMDPEEKPANSEY